VESLSSPYFLNPKECNEIGVARLQRKVSNMGNKENTGPITLTNADSKVRNFYLLQKRGHYHEIQKLSKGRVYKGF